MNQFINRQKDKVSIRTCEFRYIKFDACVIGLIQMHRQLSARGYSQKHENSQIHKV